MHAIILLLCAALACLIVCMPRYLTNDSFRHLKKHTLHVATVVTDTEDPRFRLLCKHARAHGVRVHPLVSFVPVGHGTGWFGAKLYLVRDYLYTLPVSDVFMFVDGYDVLIDASAHDILAAFRHMSRHMQTDIIFSADSGCWPDEELASRYPEVDSPYKYLCSGTYIGYVGALKRIMDTYIDFSDREVLKTADDQRVFTDIYFRSGAIALDTQNVIFNCLNMQLGDVELHPRRGWYNKETNTFPLIFHGNGWSKDHLFDVIMPGLRSQSKIMD